MINNIIKISRLALCVGLVYSASANAAPAKQMTFVSAEAASDALNTAARHDNTAALERILGPAGHKLIFSGDSVADKNDRKTFSSDYSEKHTIESLSDTKATLVISSENWPFPIPLIKTGSKWRFDTRAGVAEILNRRIGRNELNALHVCNAIVDAQLEYASEDHSGKGFMEYAPKFLSSTGKQDGLYWAATSGGPASPIGPLVVNAQAEGYGKSKQDIHAPYHGYFYRILTQQGNAAPGGARDYVVNGHMIGGFALVAFPASYGDSGIMTFIVNQSGVIYERNLGPNTALIARQMTAFNPDSHWKPYK